MSPSLTIRQCIGWSLRSIRKLDYLQVVIVLILSCYLLADNPLRDWRQRVKKLISA